MYNIGCIWFNEINDWDEGMKYEKGNIKEEHMVINEIYGLRKASVTVDLLNEMGWKEIIDEPEVLFKRIISIVTDFRYEVSEEERDT